MGNKASVNLQLKICWDNAISGHEELNSKETKAKMKTKNKKKNKKKNKTKKKTVKIRFFLKGFQIVNRKLTVLLQKNLHRQLIRRSRLPGYNKEKQQNKKKKISKTSNIQPIKYRIAFN